ncbi:polysaccharide biosynthesis protein [Paenibacillus sp. FSL H7-0357]|uniref:flippase n=1 Tax=Paenibacillus sp. FSL H7-0357 TaxID=1536774 RepID=UPI0004F6D396|nr:flippase [Paenibacillus sp. FSL H7-0357]AIQ20125.1 polysaccharide biosynthesis protein [Paenibacillus sp. FSL H7-0357]
MNLLNLVKSRLLSNEVAKKILGNSGWLVSDKVFSMILGVFITAVVARYFGPELYGEFNYALAIVSLFTVLSTLGLEILIVKTIVEKEYEEGTILCTSFLLRIIGGVILTVVSCIVMWILEPSNNSLQLIVLIMSCSMVIRSFEVIEYWIQAHQKAKISSLIRIIVSLLTAGLKLLLVYFKGDLILFALIYTIDIAIVSAALVMAYIKYRQEKSRMRFSMDYAKEILSQSWYLVLSGLMVSLYMRIDQVMLGTIMPNKDELGIFSAAVRIAEMWYFIPTAIIISFRPVIMSKKKIDKDGYIRSVQLLYNIVAWMGIVFGVFIMLFAKLIIGILYGPEYIESARILSVSIWAGIFAMLGSARGVWLVSEGLQRYSMAYIAAGCIINISLNYFLIPLYGGYGAAIATLTSQITVAIIAPAFFKPTRISSIMMLRAFNLRKIFSDIKHK